MNELILIVFVFFIGLVSGLSFGIKGKSEMEADAKFTGDLIKECKELRDKLKGVIENERV